MSVCAPSQYAELFSGAEKGIHGFQSLNLKQASRLVRQSLVVEVGHAPSDPICIPDVQEFDCAYGGNDTSDPEESILSDKCNLQDFNCESDGNGTSDSEESILSAKCDLQPDNSAKNKSPTSPEEVEDLNKDFGTVLKEIFSEGSNPLPLLSAMKGSREKSGGSPRKLTVKWAPDVYDPPPTITSHTVVRGKKPHKSRIDKKHWKEKKKGAGSSSRGSGSNGRQHRRTAASP